MRRFLTLAYTWGTLFISLVIVIVGMIAAVYNRTINDKLFSELMWFVKVALVSDAGLILGFFFHRHVKGK